MMRRVGGGGEGDGEGGGGVARDGGTGCALDGDVVALDAIGKVADVALADPGTGCGLPGGPKSYVMSSPCFGRV
jgi:hypothetical protein